jgi:hypothetical protein
MAASMAQNINGVDKALERRLYSLLAGEVMAKRIALARMILSRALGRHGGVAVLPSRNRRAALSHKLTVVKYQSAGVTSSSSAQ